MANGNDGWCFRRSSGGQPLVLCLSFALALLGTLTISTDAQASLSWHVQRVQTGWDSDSQTAGLDDISCASEHLCVAVGDGDILVSTNPAAARSAWQLEHVPGWGSPGTWASVACPSERLCVATTEESVITSTDPEKTGTWSLAHLNTPRPSWVPPEQQGLLYSELSCPTASLCMAQGNGAYSALATTANPAGGAWTITPGPLDEVNGEAFPMLGNNLACAPEGFCFERATHPEPEPNGSVGAAKQDYLMSSSSVGADPGMWQVSSGGLLGKTEPYISDAACPSAGLCLAVDSEGDVDSSQDPSAPRSWSATRVTHEGLSSVSCASTSFCAVSTGDEMLTSANPTGGRKAWSASRIPSEQDQQTNRGLPSKGALGVGTFLSCPTSSLCVAVRGDEVITGTPARPRATTGKRSNKARRRPHSHR
jgi:hypothetical protein